MGVFRKMVSVSSVGLVSFNSSKERTSKAAAKQARAALIEAKALKRAAK